MPDVGRTKELGGIFGNQLLLHAGRRRTPERESVLAMMMIIDSDELLAHEERDFAVADPLSDLRKGQADLAQPGHRIVHSCHLQGHLNQRNVDIVRTDDNMDSIRAAIEDHWRASEAGDTEVEHDIYAIDAILDYPQSGERFLGRVKIEAQRGGHPADRHFAVLRIVGGGLNWVSECVITYDGVPTYSVSIMEFVGSKVVHETQYFADPFGAPAWRTALAEPMPGRQIVQAPPGV